jgi:siroheme synthase (precorrin-2 oxidase/ferrochelatase)
MRAFPLLTDARPGPVMLLGTGDAAVAALWRLSAAGAQIRWYVDRADVGEEIALANGLGGGRIELSFDDPLTAPLDGAVVAARGDGLDLQVAERARASQVPVVVVGRPDLSTSTFAGLDGAAPAAREGRRARRLRDLFGASEAA